MTTRSPLLITLFLFFFFFFFFFFFLFTTTSAHTSSIVFTTVGRSSYDFDIFTLPTSPSHPTINQNNQLQLTDGNSINYNGFFLSSTSISLNQTLDSSTSTPPLQVVYVSEKNGFFNINLNTLFFHEFNGESRRRSALEIKSRIQIPLLLPDNKINLSIKDRPSLSGEYLVYVSTHENPGQPRKSWTAVYSTHLKTGKTRRLTPYGVADYSPSISPSGIRTAVASSGDKGWNGEIEDLNTDIYVFNTRDGSDRVKVIEHGGWPCWFDESTIYFHRKSDDGWWSVYRAFLPQQETESQSSIVIQRVTPPGLHAFTPANSAENKTFIAVATRRPTSTFRHIELFDLTTHKFIELTKPVSPQNHHYNPFITPDGTRIGYHKCRGSDNSGPFLENMNNPSPDFSLFRIAGSFPSFSPDGSRVAYVGLPGLYVANHDGSDKSKIFSGVAFSTSWDWKRKGVLYTSIGPTFATEKTEVDVISVDVNHVSLGYSFKKLTVGGQNNAFPSASPDGKWVAFRSGRTGHKNLYIMDAVDGEKAGLFRLTEGPWTDTMCNWSPDGEWIAFASDRHNPGSGSFAIYFIHPNGTGLKRVVHSGDGGRTNHPFFSPDSKSIVFTSDYAAVSAEPIANPHHYQPYGDIFVAKADGSNIQRLTHNSYEDGTPAWGPKFINPTELAELPSGVSHCDFEDSHFLNNAVVLPKPKTRCAGNF